jgi:hypothetical protein
MVIGFCLALVFGLCCGRLVGCGVVVGGGRGRLGVWIEGSCVGCGGGDGCCVCCSGGWGSVGHSVEGVIGRCHPNGDMGFWNV